MKRANCLILIAISALLFAGVTGCKKTPKGPTPIPPLTTTIQPDEEMTGPLTLGPGGAILPEDGGVRSDPFNEDGTIDLGDRELIAGMLADREAFEPYTVYFGFDKSNIEIDEMSKVEAVASFLKNESATKVQIEGHCDERGTDEYNRALGERRALGVREVLVTLGISPDRVFTISYGEDMPAVIGQDEVAYARNRRAEFVLLRPNP